MMTIKNGTEIEMTAGETGTLNVRVNASFTLASTDKLVFTLKNPTKEIVLQKAANPQDNFAAFPFEHADTRGFRAGVYWYDVRIVRSPTGSSTMPSGGTFKTPMLISKFTILETAGDN